MKYRSSIMQSTFHHLTIIWAARYSLIFSFQASKPLTKSRSSHRRCSVNKDVLKNFANFTGKHLCWSLFNKVTYLKACNFIKKTPTQVFSCEIREIFKNNYFEEHLRTTASENRIIYIFF